MNYQVNDKVCIQPESWYNENKQPNGFIVFKDNNKISTFSPGMVKFCGQVFTVAKVVTGSSIYPDHYTFVEDGGAYKWTDQMIAGLSDGSEPAYVRPAETPATPVVPKPEPKKEKVEKPAKKETKKKETPKPEPEKPKEVAKPEPSIVTTPVKEEEPEIEEENPWNDLGGTPEQVKEPVKEEPVKEQPNQPVKEPENQVKEPIKEEPVKEQPENQKKEEPVELPEPKNEPQEVNEEISAFETFTILLKPKQGAAFQDCAVQALKILSANEIFPSVTYEFNGYEVNIARKQ